MKNLLHKLFSISMAILLVVSTMSWTIEKHLCMGQVVDVAWFSHAENCSMKAGLTMLSNEVTTKKHCCNDEAFTMQGQDDLTHDSVSELDFSQKIFLVSFASSYIRLFQDFEEKDIVIKSYPPPILAENLNILHQVFLI